MPFQLPAVGVVAVPSLSPPTLSSWIEVKVTGLAAVPAITRRPPDSTVSPAPSNLATVPADTVNVNPDGTVKPDSVKQQNVKLLGVQARPVVGQVVSTARRPPMSR